ncbi:MAG: tetratricopeptide repeat protein [Pseudonocardiales bacterium]|nr:tetratricopeptide repeat protein [Pseudonocardiales bacterium]
MNTARASHLPTYRTIFAVDVVAFTRPDRNNLTQLAIRRVMYRVLRDAFELAGVPWRGCVCEDRGDGALIFVPGDVSKAVVLGTMINALTELVKAHNNVAPPPTGFRLRTAVHAGEVHRDRHGFAGVDVNLVCRLLDAPVFREAMDRSGFDVGVIISEYIYESVVLQRYMDINPASYRHVDVAVKRTKTRGWLRLVGEDPVETGQVEDPFEGAANSTAIEQGEQRPRAELVPRQLGFVPRLIDRENALAALDRALEDKQVAVVSGSPGVGKTALAISWAYRVTDRFRDGQLYLDLRGYSPAPALTAAEAVETLLSAFGADSRTLPMKLDARIGRYRSLLARRRVLLVFDNIDDPILVRSLLPGGHGCFTLVTSRREQPGLVALQDAHPIRLQPLDPADSVTLLSHVCGEKFTADETTLDLARRCGHLPLALRIVAAQLRSTKLSPTEYLIQVAHCGLASWETPDDGEAAVRSAFDLSYSRLSPDAARLLRLLGLVPGPDFSSSAAAALIDSPTEEAERLLGVLTSSNLIEQRVPGRYQFHDLLRLYARSRAESDDSPAERDRAERHLFDWYLGTSGGAVDRIFPSHPRLPRPTSDDAVRPLVFAGSDDARDWLGIERAGLVAVAKRAVQRGDTVAIRNIAYTLCRGFWTRFHGADWLNVATAALDSTRDEDNPRMRAIMHLAVGAARWGTGDIDAAATHYASALELVPAEDTAMRALAHIQLGVAYRFLGGRWRQAMDHLTRALELRRRLDDRHGQASVLVNLCALCTELAELDNARLYATEALTIVSTIDYSSAESMALDTLGQVALETGRPRLAIEYFRRALARRQIGGDRLGQPSTRIGLALAYLAEGTPESFDEAKSEAERALAIAREISERVVELDALNVLGEVSCQAGDTRDAIRHHLDALSLALSVDNGYGVVRAHAGLAEAHLIAGALELAAGHAAEALNVVRANNHRLVEGRVHHASARIHVASGDLAAAKEAWTRAAATCRETKQLGGELDALLALARIASDADEHDAAMAYTRRAEEIRTFLHNNQPE